MSREPRRWTAEEDQSLIRSVNEHTRRPKKPGHPISWSRISNDIIDRSNKDCRKRWVKLSVGRNRGGWEVAEDQRLVENVRIYGNRWTIVAKRVQTRNADQCAKRWQHCLDPSLDRSEWTPEQDARLLEAAERHGNNWKLIEEIEFPKRSRTCLKNRHIALTKQGSKIQQRPRLTNLSSSPNQPIGIGIAPIASTFDDTHRRDEFQYLGHTVSPNSNFPSNSAISTSSRCKDASVSTTPLVNNRTSQSTVSNLSMLTNWEQMFYNESFLTPSAVDLASTPFPYPDNSTLNWESSQGHPNIYFPVELQPGTDSLSTGSCSHERSLGGCRENDVDGLLQGIVEKNSSTVPQIMLRLYDPSPKTVASLLAILMDEKSKGTLMVT